MDRWKTGGLAAILVLALALVGCDSGESNEDLMDPGSMPVMSDGGGEMDEGNEDGGAR